MPSAPLQDDRYAALPARALGDQPVSTLLVTGIAELVTNDPAHPDAEPAEGLGTITDAAVVVADGAVRWVGRAVDAQPADRALDLGGRALLPGFVDSHSHLVFAGDRSAEFAARMTGQRYDGGGIATTVAATAEASDDDLRALLAARVGELRAQGTTTIEVKSGYALTVEGEARLLRLARELTTETTYLGAHVVPPQFSGRRTEYVDLVCGEMLDACAPYARWVDVFCEPHSPHAFTEDEARAVLAAGIARGLLPRVHGSDTVATLLPGVEFSTRSPYPDARRLLDAGVRVAIATDCNPGTCYSTSMPFMVALAVREMGMSPAHAVRAATLGGAQALRREDIGRVVVGARADLTVLDAPSHRHLAYRAGVPLARALDLG